MGAVLWFALAFYLNMRSLKYEEPMLQTLRRWILAWHSWGGTDFRDSNLQGADFSRANLRHAQFCGTQLIGCRWQNAQNLHLADTRHSLLEPRPVRVLLSSGEITTRDFSLFNLRGVVLAGLDLRSINFYHADLSLAGFRGCDLSNCDLSEVMALGTDFSQATLTGTIIDGWNIDKTTRFDEAECHFVYLKRDKSERNPPQGEFGDGDFAKLYQEIANTVDFIAHTPAELQALLRAIETIKAQGGSIFIQQMERKAESVVLRVQSEPNAEIDKPDIYAEVQRQKAIELLAIRQEYEQKFLQGELKHMQELRTAEKENMDLLAQLLRSAIDKPTSVTFENNFMTQDHSRRIENVTMNNSNANLGDNSSQRIRIEQLPDGQLKILLQKLSDLIDQAPLTKHDRQLVEEQLNQLTMLSTQSKPESRDEVGKTLGLLKDLSTIFKDLPNIGSQYGVLLGELVQLLI